jgi:hypothetical protein
MSISTSDIKFYLSGGFQNSDPNASIGGDISERLIVGTLNNLFNNVSELESKNGHEDYRCFYVANTNETDTLYDMEIYLESLPQSGISIEIGTYWGTEVQRMTLTGNVITGGTITLSFGEETTDPISWDGDADAFRINMQNALNNLGALEGISIPDVSMVPLGTYPYMTYYLDIYFEGVDDNRSQALIEIADLSLTGCDDGVIARVSAGGPINTIASAVDFDTIVPYGIAFTSPTEDEPIEIGDLRSDEKIPIWVKRTVSAGTEATPNDKFTLRIRGATT